MVQIYYVIEAFPHTATIILPQTMKTVSRLKYTKTI